MSARRPQPRYGWHGQEPDILTIEFGIGVAVRYIGQRHHLPPGNDDTGVIVNGPRTTPQQMGMVAWFPPDVQFWLVRWDKRTTHRVVWQTKETMERIYDAG